jgi:preprotein translocase subunit SecG
LYNVLLAIHIIVSLLLVIVVLLQSGKAADLAGAFGGMGSQSTFGPRGAATLLSKMTTTLAVLFMVTSLALYIIAYQHSGPATVVEGVEAGKPAQTTTAPAPVDSDKATVPVATEQQQKDTGTGDTGKVDQKDKPAATASEPVTTDKNTSTDTEKKEEGKEPPPKSANSKQQNE